MTRPEYIAQFVKKYGSMLAVNLRGEHTYLIPIEHLVKHGIKGSLMDAQNGLFKEVTGTPEAEQDIPDKEIVALLAVIEGSAPAPVGIYKLPDDPLGVTRVSIGGSTKEAVYAIYRGPIQSAIKLTEMALHLLKEQAKKGEASPPPNPELN